MLRPWEIQAGLLEYETLTLAGTWAPINADQDLEYAKVGRLVVLRGAVDSGGAATIGTLPEGFRPAKPEYIAGYDTNVTIQTNGDIDADAFVGKTVIFGSNIFLVP